MQTPSGQGFGWKGDWKIRISRRGFRPCLVLSAVGQRELTIGEAAAGETAGGCMVDSTSTQLWCGQSCRCNQCHPFRSKHRLCRAQRSAEIYIGVRPLAIEYSSALHLHGIGNVSSSCLGASFSCFAHIYVVVHTPCRQCLMASRLSPLCTRLFLFVIVVPCAFK